MLKEKITKATNLVQKYTDLQKKDNKIKQYTNLLARIDELKPMVKNTAQSFAALHRGSPENFTKFQSQATEELMWIKKDLRSGDFPILKIKSVKETLAEQEATLQENWQNYVKQLSSSTENTLSLLGSLQENPDKITDVTISLNDLREQWPVSDRHLELLEDSIATGQKILVDLSLDNEIEEFLIKVIQQEARLSDLNQKIVEWLNYQNMAKKLLISIEHE